MGTFYFSPADPRGRLAAITQGSGANVRQTSLAYNPQGYLGSITDALGRSQSFLYDAAGRVTPNKGQVLQ